MLNRKSKVLLLSFIAAVCGLEVISLTALDAHFISLIRRKCADEIPVSGANDAELDKIRQALERLPREMRDAVIGISVADDGAYQDWSGGHCLFRQISLRPGVWDKGGLRHETAHAYVSTLPGEAVEEWKRIANYPWSGSGWGRQRSAFPQKGILNDYSSSRPEEDIAEWVKFVYEQLDGDSRYFALITDRHDTRYIRKLRWLLKWKLIVLEDYKALAPLLR